MPLTAAQARSLSSLGFAHAPVAVAFTVELPSGLSRVPHSEAAGCGYWKLASEGRAFYTTPEDHGNCPIGAFTHGVQLSAEKGRELESTILHRVEPMQVAAYAPLDRATFSPEVVLFRGNVRQIMLLSEAARRAGAFEASAVMGRPACAMIPQALGARTSVASVGCIGNRVYTGLGDDELYLAVPGSVVEKVIDALETILTANAELEKFHKARQAALAG